jgi:hypothetical protein
LFVPDARAAIEAMREPTEAQLVAWQLQPKLDDWREQCRSDWQAMIDEALQ